jgi:hypothetical protein
MPGSRKPSTASQRHHQEEDVCRRGITIYRVTDADMQLSYRQRRILAGQAHIDGQIDVPQRDSHVINKQTYCTHPLDHISTGTHAYIDISVEYPTNMSTTLAHSVGNLA